MHLCVFEDEHVHHLLPLVYTRAVYDLRLGIRTLLQSIRESFGSPGTVLHCRESVARVTGQEYDLLVNDVPDGIGVLFVNGRWVVEEGGVLDRIRRAADESEARTFVENGELVAAWIPSAAPRYVEHDAVTAATFDGVPTEEVEGVRWIRRLWDLQNELEPALLRDYSVRTKGLYVYERPGVDVQDGALLAGGERIYMGPGTVVRPGAVLNADHGPIYIDDDVEIKESAVVKGPIYIGPKSTIMSGADVEGCAFGFWTKVGGQVENTIIHSLSNKAHAGFLGNAYLGRWCNLGADTSNSNLKNDYGDVSMYDEVEGDFVSSDQTFLGLVMGDHSKCGINTMFNTGTVVGVSCNLYGAGFMPRYIPSFSWGGPDGVSEYRLEKALRVADVVMRRRERALTDADRENLEAVFEVTRGADVII